MPDLIEKKTGATRKVDHEEVDDLIGSGRYQLAEGAQYHVSLPGGDIELFDASQATHMIHGSGRYLSAERADKVREHQEYADRPISAGLAGAFDYGTMGLGPAAIKALMPEVGESLEKVEGYNTGAYHGTGVVGSIALAILSKGSSLMAQGMGAISNTEKAGLAAYRLLRKQGLTPAKAKAAMDAGTSAQAVSGARSLLRGAQTTDMERVLLGKLAGGYGGTDGMTLGGKMLTGAVQLNAPAVVNRAGALAHRVVTDFIGKHGTHAVIPGLGKSFAELAPLSAKVTSGVSGLVADGVVQGGLYGFGEGLSEVALGDVDNAAEHIISTMGMNMMFGAAGGAGFGLAIPFIGKMATGAMKATGGSYGYFAKSAVSKAMTDSLARISFHLDKGLKTPDELRELQLLYRLDDVGKLARNDMMELAKRIDDLGGRMTESTRETFLIEEIRQQADKNGINFQTIRELMHGSGVPAIEVLEAFEEVMMGTTASAKDLANSSSLNKQRLESFLREWADEIDLDDVYGPIMPMKGQKKRAFRATKDKPSIENGRTRLLMSPKLDKFFNRVVDYLHLQNIGSQEAKVKGAGVITDREHAFLDNFNRFVEENIAFYKNHELLTPSERSDMVAALNKARNSGDLDEVTSIIDTLKNSNRHRWTGSRKSYTGRLHPDVEYSLPSEARKQATRDPVDPATLKVDKKTQDRIDKIESIIKTRETNAFGMEDDVRALSNELKGFQEAGPGPGANATFTRQLAEKQEELAVAVKALQKEKDAVDGLRRNLDQLSARTADAHQPADDMVEGRETLEELRNFLFRKIGRVRSVVEDERGRKKEVFSSFRGIEGEVPPNKEWSPDHRLLLDKKMVNYNDYEMDVFFPDISMTPQDYRTLQSVERAIKEGKTYLDEAHLNTSRMVDEWEALPKLTQSQIGLRRRPGTGPEKINIFKAKGRNQLVDAVKGARFKLNTMPDTVPRAEAEEMIRTIRQNGRVKDLIQFLNEDQMTGINATDLQTVIWDEMQRVNNFFHESYMGHAISKGSSKTGVEDIEALAHRFLENPKIFGERMQQFMSALQDDRKNYATLQEQFRSLFGMQRGTREYIDPDALTSWITNLKSRTAVGDIGKITEHTELGIRLLDHMSDNFDLTNMDFKFSQITQELLKEMGIVKIGPGVWKQGKKTLGSKALFEQLRDRMVVSAAQVQRDLDFVTKEARNALRWSAATANAANTRSLMRPSSFMGYFGGPALGVAVNVVESIQDPRLAIARLHAIETLAEQGRKESEHLIDTYIDYMATGKKAPLRLPRSLIGPAVSVRDVQGAAAEQQRRERYRLSEEQYDDAKDFLVLMASSPAQLESFTDAAVSPLGDSAPLATQAMKTLLKEKILYMHKMLPAAARGSMFDSAPRPSTMQMARFARVLEAVNDPVGAMAWGLMKGTLTREVIEAVQVTSPSIFSDVRAKLMEKLADTEFSSEISRQNKMMLSALFNIPIVRGRLGARLRENVRPGEKPGPDAQPKKPIKTDLFQSPVESISRRP